MGTLVLPRLAAQPRVATSPQSRVRQLDEALFQPTFWALNAHNAQVKGVIAATLDQAHALIGQGNVATFYGVLRPGVWAVDIDVAGLAGEAIAEHIAGWAYQRGLWHIVRPSGGGEGRTHVIIRLDDALGDLEAYLLDLRRTYAVTGPKIDLRKPLRPLSAPHRYGGWSAPYGIDRALASLTTAAPGRAAGGDREHPPGHRRAAALAPRDRNRRPLPEQWETYLTTGIRPAQSWQDRSTIELVTTAAMLRAGWSAQATWEAIQTAHPQAMTKARSRGQGWWTRHVWNIAAANDSATPLPAAQPDAATGAAVAAARDALTDLGWALTPRQRPAVLLIGHTILDRMARTSSHRVSVNQRDLHEDTGLSRPTISAILRVLHGPVGALHTDTLDRSPQTRATTSYEFEILPAPGASQSSPPSNHTPLPPGSWRVLPRATHQLWRALETSEDSGLGIENLCVTAQLTDTPGDGPSARQLRTAAAALTALAVAGIARCDAHGRWTRTTTTTCEFHQQASQDLAAAHAVIRAERDDYRRGTGSTWAAQQRTALLNLEHRYKQWWRSLPPDERIERRAEQQMRYAALTLHEQAKVKDDLAGRRRRAGLDEPARLAAWVQQWSPRGWEQRVVTRAATFATLAPPEKAAHVRAWTRHRERHNLPIARPAAESAITPSAQVRDDIFLANQASSACALPGMPALDSA